MFLANSCSNISASTSEGQENIPQNGAAIIAPNHSGFSGFDALILGHLIYKSSGRIARILTHKLWFASTWTSVPMKKLGFVKATREKGHEVLEKDLLLILFPEGEQGNFKPTNKRYHLQEFKKGFIRLAIKNQCPIVPTLILGAEETHINLAQFKMQKKFLMPIPLNILPLPARWRIIFMDPIPLPYKPEQAEDRELVNELCEEIREKMQQKLSLEVSKRKHLYF